MRGAWLHQAGAGRTFCVVSIKQRYLGHSTQVGLVASQVASVGYISRWIVVVDDDVDPTDIHDVIWAMGTRCDPKTRTTMLDHCWSSRLDTMVFDYSKLTNSRMVIDACKPYEHYDTFPKVAMTSPELRGEDPREMAGALSLTCSISTSPRTSRKRRDPGSIMLSRD